MIRFLILFTFLHVTLFACATCAVMTPMTEVQITLQGDGKSIHNIHYRWEFSEIYSSELRFQFDDNNNGVIDAAELAQMQRIKIDYLQPRMMLSELTYSSVGSDETQELLSSFKNFELSYEGRHFVFSYDGALQLTPQSESIMSFRFEDSEGYFDFRVVGVNVEGLDYHVRPNTYLFTAALLFENPATLTAPAVVKPSVSRDRLEQPVSQPVKELGEKVLKSEPTLLEQSITAIKALLDEIKAQQSAAAVALLLLFSYLYGLIHALGPGHGKTLVSSYFLGNERSIAKALYVALAIGVVHTFSAFFLTAIVYFVLNQLLSQVMDDVVRVTTVISALIIIGIALWLIYSKYKIYRKKPVYGFQSAPPKAFSPLHVTQDRALHVASCGCHACKVDKDSTDAALIISAGIVPCPGTVTLFIFAFSLGLYGVGVAAALVMSLGMSSIIFISAALSTLLRTQATARLDRIKPLLEFGSLGVILLLGLLLLLI